MNTKLMKKATAEHGTLPVISRRCRRALDVILVSEAWLKAGGAPAWRALVNKALPDVQPSSGADPSNAQMSACNRCGAATADSMGNISNCEARAAKAHTWRRLLRRLVFRRRVRDLGLLRQAAGRRAGRLSHLRPRLNPGATWPLYGHLRRRRHRDLWACSRAAMPRSLQLEK